MKEIFKVPVGSFVVVNENTVWYSLLIRNNMIFEQRNLVSSNSEITTFIVNGCHYYTKTKDVINLT